MNAENVRDVKRRLKERRLKLGLTQSKLADAVGVKQPIISRIEDQRAQLGNIKTVSKIAKALGFSLTLIISDA